MNGEKNRIDDQFRDGMEGHLEMPSPLVWDKIEKELDKKDKKRPFIFFLTSFKKPATLLLFVTIIGCILTGSYFLLRSLPDTNEHLQSDSTHININIQPDGGIKPDTPSALHKGIEEIQENNTTEQGNKKGSSEDLPNPKQPVLRIQTEKKKERPKNNSVSTQPNQNTTHHIDADLNTKNVNLNSKNIKLTGNSKEQLRTKHPSNLAVANQPYVHESVPFKNKTDVAGSPAIIQSAGKINHNASAIQVFEEQNKLSLIARVNDHQHDIGPIVKCVVSFKAQPTTVKAPTTLVAPATNVNLKQTDSSEKKSTKKNIYFTLTPVFQNQLGKIRLVDIPPPPPQIPPVTTFSRFKMGNTDYKKSAGIYAGLHIGGKWNIQSGLLYSTQYFKTDTAIAEAVLRPDGNIKYMIENVVGSLYIDPARGDNPTTGSLVDVYRITTAFSYLQLPLQVNYYFGKGKLKASATIGGTYNKIYKLSLSGVMMDLNAKHIISDKELSLNKSYVHAVLGGGIQWNFYNNLSFMLAPQYHLSITPNYKSINQKSYPNTLTIQTGIQVGIHK